MRKKLPFKVHAVLSQKVSKDIADKKNAVEQSLKKLDEYMVAEDWDSARGLCHLMAAHFEKLRDCYNRLNDIQ